MALPGPRSHDSLQQCGSYPHGLSVLQSEIVEIDAVHVSQERARNIKEGSVRQAIGHGGSSGWIRSGSTTALRWWYVPTAPASRACELSARRRGATGRGTLAWDMSSPSGPTAWMGWSELTACA